MLPSNSLHFLDLYSHYCCKPSSNLIIQLPGLSSDPMHIYTAWLKLTLCSKPKFFLEKIFTQLRGYNIFFLYFRHTQGSVIFLRLTFSTPLIFQRVLISLTCTALWNKLERNILIGQIDAEEKSDES